MSSRSKRFRRNSPEAVARVLAAVLTDDGLLASEEIDLMDRLGVYGIVGVPRDLFLNAVAKHTAARAAPGHAGESTGANRCSRLDAALEAIEDRGQRLVICAVLVYLAEADRTIADEERTLVRHVLERWNVGAEELERELNVPRRRLQPFLEPSTLEAPAP